MDLQVNCSPNFVCRDDCRDGVVIVQNMVVASDALNCRRPCVDPAVWSASNRSVFGMAQAHANDTEQPFDMLHKIEMNAVNQQWQYRFMNEN